MATENNFFNDVDWTKLQQQYVDAVSSFYSTPTQKSSNPWQEAMEFWWQSVGGQLPDKNKTVFNSVLDQSKVFYSIANQFTSMLNDISKQPSGQDDWQGIMFSHLEKMKSMFDLFQQNSDLSSMVPGMMWASPMDMWNQVMSSMIPDESASKLLEIPGIGLTRDLQQKSQKTIRLWNDYQQNSNKYNATFAMLGKQALDKLGQDILVMAESDKKITSLKDLYNMWVDANEEMFAEYAQTEEYSKLYADLVNSLVRFKKHYNEMMDDVLKNLNLPTTQGMGSITKQQHDIKKELHHNRQAQEKLQSAMKKLQSELDEMNRTKKTTVQKKKTGKKATSKNNKMTKPLAKKPSNKATKKAAKKTAAKKKPVKKSK